MDTPALPFEERLLPAPRNGGFRMPGFWVWCGSAIRGDDGASSSWTRTADGPGGFSAATETWNLVIPLRTPPGP